MGLIFPLHTMIITLTDRQVRNSLSNYPPKTIKGCDHYLPSVITIASSPRTVDHDLPAHSRLCRSALNSQGATLEVLHSSGLMIRKPHLPGLCGSGTRYNYSNNVKQRRTRRGKPSKQKQLDIYYCNVNGFKGKLESIKAIMEKLQPKIIL